MVTKIYLAEKYKLLNPANYTALKIQEACPGTRTYSSLKMAALQMSTITSFTWCSSCVRVCIYIYIYIYIYVCVCVCTSTSAKTSKKQMKQKCHFTGIQINKLYSA